MARILWLAGEYLRPADSGMYRYSLDMAEALEDMGHSIHFVGRRRSENDPVPHPENWTLLPRRSPSMLRKVLGLRPAKVIEIWDSEYGKAVTDTLESFEPDVVLLDHLRVAAALDVIDVAIPTVYLSQNDETLVKEKMVRAATGVRQLVRRCALWADLLKIRRTEDRLLSTCVASSAISAADIRTFATRHPQAELVHTPPVYRGTRLAWRDIDASVPRRIGVISTLFWGAKVDNLVHALDGLAPLVREGVEVVVFTGGYPPPQEVMDQNPDVSFLGFVDDLGDALGKCRLGLVYEPVGGGFKMKTLDFIYHRVPLVVGAGSAESLPLTSGEHLVEVSDHHKLAPALRPLLDDFDELNRFQEQAFLACSESFGNESVRALSDQLDTLGRVTH